MSALLTPGEFSLADKLQSGDYIQGRTGALQRLHRMDPQLAAEVISYAWPHAAARQWTDDELHERLGTQAKKRRSALKTAELTSTQIALMAAPFAIPLAFAAPSIYRLGKALPTMGRVVSHELEKDSDSKKKRVKAASLFLGKFAEAFVDSYMWTDDELHERLGIPVKKKRQTTKVATTHARSTLSPRYKSSEAINDYPERDSVSVSPGVLARPLEKASSVAAIGLTAALGHLSSNAAAISAHHGTNLAEVMSHKGFQHGMLDQKIHPWRQKAISWLMGPEALMNYEAARHAGRGMVEGPLANPHVRAEALRKFTETTHDIPIVGPVQRAMSHELAGTEPKLQHAGGVGSLYARALMRLSRPTQTGFESTGQKIVGAASAAAPLAMAGALAPVEPGILGHLGWNAARGVMGESRLGQRVVAESVRQGLHGAPMSQRMGKVIDYAASPGALEPQRAAFAIHKKNPAMAETLSGFMTPENIQKAMQVKTASIFLGKFAEAFVDSYMPSVGAAFDAFKFERQRQNAISQAENAAKYPALHFTQPMMASYAMGGAQGGMGDAPPVHHRRHRHHSG